MEPKHNGKDDSLHKVQREVDDVKVIMQANIGKVIDRGEKLETLESKTDDLMTDARVFRKRAGEAKRMYCMKNAKLTLILALVIIVIIFFIIVGACGGFTFAACKGS